MFEALAIIVGLQTISVGQQPYPGPISSRFTRDGLVVSPAPYPPTRTDGPNRLENGRLWIARTPVGSRRPIREQVLPGDGAAYYGAMPETGEDVVYVQTREPLPVIAISPWDTLDEANIEHMKRLRPWIRRTDSILDDMRQAQTQWLKEQGYIKKVRTHVNPKVQERLLGGQVVSEAPGTPRVSPAAQESPKPRAVIRVRPAPANDPYEIQAMRVSEPQITRVSAPGSSPRSPIVVVRPAEPQRTAEKPG